MPELPEVETVRIGLNRLLPARVIKSVKHDWPKSFPNAPADIQRFLLGAKIQRIKRRAKVLLIELDSKYSLVIHLKMTGQLVFVGAERFGAGHPNSSLVDVLPDKSTRVTLDLGDSKLFFNDQRKFGWMRLMPTAEVANLDFFKKVGPEPLSASFGPSDLKKRLLKRPNSSVKAALLDQSVIAGVGNIYADESLWGAKIHPATPIHQLSSADINKLYNELIMILKLAIKMGGSSNRNYVNAEGKTGSYQTIARVFRREGQPCPRCDMPLTKVRVAGRGTHLCPKCQRLAK